MHCCKISKHSKEGSFGDIEKFSEKIENIRTENKNFEQSHSAEKCKSGPFGLLQHPSSCKISNKLKRDPLETLKNLEKSLKAEKGWEKSQCRKIGKGDPSVFCISS